MISEEDNLHHLEADSTQLQIIRRKKHWSDEKRLLQFNIPKGVEYKVPLREGFNWWINILSNKKMLFLLTADIISN